MEFRILGPLEILEAGGALPLGGAKQRALLAILLINANKAVATDRLIELLWGDEPPETANNVLQVYVSQFRKLLEPRHRRGAQYQVLVSQPPGYLLHVEAGQLDLSRFEELVEESRQAMARDDPEAAARTLREALTIWRGPPLADVAREPFAVAEVARLTEIRLRAVEARIDADLALDRHADMVGDLQALVAEHPLRERLCGQLMLALYRSGRQAEASDVYQRTRQRLVDELGMEPGRELQLLLKRILQQELELDGAPSTATGFSSRPVQMGSFADPASAANLLPSGTVTFLFTDLEGSTILLRELGTEGYRLALEQHRMLLRRAFDHFHGHEVDANGDSFFIAFAKPSDGVAAALEAQQALAAHEWQGGTTLRVRMGLHVGEATPVDGRYVAEAVHEAARVASAAHGGEVLLSAPAAELTGSAIPEGAEFEDLGEHRLKDLASPIRLKRLRHSALRADLPPPRTLEGHRNNLPAHLTRLIGRDNEILEVIGLIEQERLVTLTGAGGVGKTRLALSVAAELVDGFRGGAWLIDLASVRDSDRVDQAVCDALGLRASAGKAAESAVEDYLRLDPAILVVDNCEHLVAPVTALVADLLASCPELKVITTSRELLGIPGERAWRVPSLAVPAASDEIESKGVAGFGAIALFCARARDRRDDFRLTDDNAGDIARICARLDGVPLAIELAAARIGVLAPAQILTRLDDRFRLLTGGSRTAIARQQTLQAAVDWSHDLLSHQEKALFRRLAVFSGSGSLEAAEAICAGADVEPETVLDLLDSLVAKSLVMSELRGEVARYRLLETIRHYAQQKLIDSGESQYVTDRHLDYHWALARRLDDAWIIRGDEETWADAFVAEGDNLRAAFDWAVAADRWAEATGLAASLSVFWMWEGKSSEAATYLRRVEAHIDECPIETGALALAMLCWTVRTREQQRALARRLVVLIGEPPATARLAACTAVGRITLAWTDELPEENIRASLDAARRCSRHMEVAHLLLAAEAWIARGDVSRGRDMAEQALNLCQPGWLALRTQASEFLAIASRASGDSFSARRFAERAVADARGVPRFSNALLTALSIVSEAAAGEGDNAEAMRAATEMVDVARSLGRLSLAEAYNTLGVVAGRAGDAEQAREALGRGLALTTADSDLVNALILSNLGALDLLEGRNEQSESRARECVAAAKEMGDGTPRPLNLLGLLAARRGDVSAALYFHSEAYRAFGVPESDELVWINSLDEMALTMIGFAGAIANEHPADAGRLLGATEVVTSPAAFLSVIRRSERDRLAAFLREQLGDDAYENAVAAGRALSRVDALSLVESFVRPVNSR